VDLQGSIKGGRRTGPFLIFMSRGNPVEELMSLIDRPLRKTIDAIPSPVLETERLVLRAPRHEDAKSLVAIINDRRIAEKTGRIPHPYTLDDARDWIDGVIAEGTDSFLITAGGEIIGGCGYELRNSVPEIGYWIGVPFWGNGYATEAARALVDHAFSDHFYAALISGALVSNPASRRVLEKCGFEWTGVSLLRVQAINSSAPLDRFRLERSAWASLRARAVPPKRKPTRRVER
jgi:RimJ/RimL family protein N-acetyltransferase